MNFNKVNYSIILRTENSMKYGILARQEVSGYTVDEYPNIAIRQAGGYWYIDHIPTGLKISTFGCKSRKAALENYPEIYGDRIKNIEENRKDFLKQAAERLQTAPLDSDIASWETVNYCTIYNHRFDKVTDAARRAGLLIQKADNNTYMDGGNINIIGSPEALKPIKEIIEKYAERDRQKAEEAAREAQTAQALEAVQPAQEAPEAVAAFQPEPEALEAQKTTAERPETISAGSPAAQAEPEAQKAPAAPEQDPGAVILVETTYDIRNGGSSTRRVLYTPGKGLETIPEKPEAVAVQPEPVPEKKPEARPRRQAPEKPARGPGKPLDFIGQTLAGNGWQIVFDTGLQRTRVIIEEAAREKAAPLAEAAGFYYSVNTDSWHKKLSHKAHRAAEALAEQLRAAC